MDIRIRDLCLIKHYIKSPLDGNKMPLEKMLDNVLCN